MEVGNGALELRDEPTNRGDSNRKLELEPNIHFQMEMESGDLQKRYYPEVHVV